MQIKALILIFFLYGISYCGLSLVPAGARPSGMGNAWFGMENAPECLFHNPAGLSREPALSFCLSRLYGLEALSSASFLVAFRVSFMNIGIGLQHFGRSPYTETAFNLGASLPLFKCLTIGLRIRSIRTCIDPLWSGVSSHYGFSLLFRPVRALNLGLGINSSKTPDIARIEVTDHVCLGMTFLGLQGMILSLDIEKYPLFPMEVRGGIEFSPLRGCFIRAGFSGNPSTLSFGIGTIQGRTCLDYGLNQHPVLGTSHALSVTFILKKTSAPSSP